jgi:hypothetical protein
MTRTFEVPREGRDFPASGCQRAMRLRILSKIAVGRRLPATGKGEFRLDFVVWNVQASPVQVFTETADGFETIHRTVTIRLQREAQKFPVVCLG